MGFLFVIGLGILTTAAITFIGYKVWVLIVLGLLWVSAVIYSFIFGHRGFGGGPNTDVQVLIAGAFISIAILIPKYNAQKPCNQARSTMKMLVEAEGGYFREHKTYATDIKLLKLKPDPQISIMITRADEQSFAAEVAHLSCDENRDGTPDLLIWDSAEGGMRP